MMKNNQSGFTLIEIAIVLVIIGLLLGGVLKGQELINSAKVKNLATDFRNIPVFIYGYQDKFKSLPGDDGNAPAHLGVASSVAPAGNNDGIIGGRWDDAANSGTEAYNFWAHVRLAGLTSGSTILNAADYLPVNAVGGFIGIQSGTSTAASAPLQDSTNKPIAGTYIICSPNILGKFAKQLDIQLDDGNTATGSMLVYDVTAGGAYVIGKNATATADVKDADITIVCNGV
jgi:prepilin-type N-terminal cleavage/methylation domain-containing protein